jgi:hypothetical protein
MLCTLKLSPLSILALSALFPLAPAFSNKADAMCIMADVNVQLAIHGSQKPANQVNSSSMNANEDCTSGVSVTHNTQVGIAPGEVNQYRKNDSTINSPASEQFNLPGMSGPAIKIPVDVKVDVYSPAHDPTFLNNTFGNNQKEPMDF